MNNVLNFNTNAIPQHPLPLWDIGGISFIGPTGGAIPQGPQSEYQVDTTAYSQGPSGLPQSVGNSTSHVQGLHVRVSCQNVSSVPINVSTSMSQSIANVSGTCPDGSSRNWTLPFSVGGIAVLNCSGTSPLPTIGNYTLYIATLGTPDIPTFGNLACGIDTQILSGQLAQYSLGSGNGYVWSTNAVEAPENVQPAFDIAKESVAGLTAALTIAQTNAGNLFVGSFLSLLLSSITTSVEPSLGSSMTLDLVGAMLEGIISYEVSRMTDLVNPTF